MPVIIKAIRLRRPTSAVGRKGKATLTGRRFIPNLERLEDRTAPAVNVFINPFGGSWFFAPNWSLTRVPTAGDDVIIPDLPGEQTITYSPSFFPPPNPISSLTLGENVEVRGLLTVNGSVRGNGTITLVQTFSGAGGTLARARVDAGITIIGHRGALDGVTLDGNLMVVGAPLPLGGTATLGSVGVLNGLTVNGTVTLGNPDSAGELSLGGNQTLGGSGQVLFSNGPSYINYSSGTLTLGPDLVIRGQHVQIIHTKSIIPPPQLMIQGTVETLGIDPRIRLGQNTVIAPSGRLILGDGTQGEAVGVVHNRGLIRLGTGGLLRVGPLLPGSVTNVGAIILGRDGRLQVGGPFTQTAAGSLNIDIGGHPPVPQSGRLAVSTANLTGTLRATLVNGFQPNSGQSFLAVSSFTRNGVFTSFSGGGLKVTYVGPNVFLNAASPAPVSDIEVLAARLVNPTTAEIDYRTTGAPGSFSVGFYLSADERFDPGFDAPVGNLQEVTPKGGKATQSFALKSPALSDASRPFLLVVADPLNAVVETNEANNSAAIPGPRRQPFTVITHGFLLTGDESLFASEPISPWVFDLRDALQGQGLGSVRVFDWAAESNDASPGWAEASGDRLFARLVWELQQLGGPADLHYIGHSRGTVVNSEANRRLAYYQQLIPGEIGSRVGTVQVTMLDAHPASAVHGPGVSGLLPLLASEGLFELLADDPRPQVWDNVEWADAYFQRRPHENCSASSFALNLFGLSHPQAYSVDLTGAFLEDGTPVCHTTIGGWYGETVRANTALRAGWHYSLAGAGWHEDPSRRPPPGRAQGANPSAPPTVFNGDFAYDGSIAIDLPSFLLTAESGRIPGWVGDVMISPKFTQRFVVPGAITHELMFFPPSLDAVQFSLNKIAKSAGKLKVFFVPARVPPGGENPELDTAGRIQLGDEINLASLKQGSLTPFMRQLPSEAIGRVGSIEFEVAGKFLNGDPLPQPLLVDLDDVQLISSGLPMEERSREGERERSTPAGVPSGSEADVREVSHALVRALDRQSLVGRTPYELAGRGDASEPDHATSYGRDFNRPVDLAAWLSEETGAAAHQTESTRQGIVPLDSGVDLFADRFDDWLGGDR